MDNKKQHDTAKENRKLKNTFSVPVKKSETSAHETKNGLKAGLKYTCPENKVHISFQSDNKTNTERVKPSGKKTPKQVTQKKLHSTEQHDESSSISSQSDSTSSEADSFSSDNISRTIAEVIGRTKQKSKNTSNDSESLNENNSKQKNVIASDDSESLCENDSKQKNVIASDDSESLYEKDIDNWDLEKTDVCGTPKSPQLVDNVSTKLSPGNTDSTRISLGQEETGTWVQCGNKKCNKWRYLADVEDPVLIPEIWECSMNPDKEHNSCDIPQMEYQEAEHIYTKYTIGTCVWAKLEGYPWWPAMVECDPDNDMYYQASPQAPMVPLEYHVSFFDDNVSRSWVRSRCIIPYKGQLPKEKISDCYLTNKKEIQAAMKNADKALPLRLKDRVEIFGFQKRFSSKGVSKKRSSKKTKSSKLRGSAGHIFLKSESLSYTQGVHKSPSFQGCGPLKKISQRKPLETIIKDQTGKSKVHTAKDIQSNTETTSKTHGETFSNKLSKTFSGLDKINIKAGCKNGNSDEKENNTPGLLDKADNKLPNKKRKHPKQKLPGTDDGHKPNKKFILKESDTNSLTDKKENNMPGLMDKAENKLPNKKRKHLKQKLPGTDDGHKPNKKFIFKESDTKSLINEKEKNMSDLLGKTEKTLSGSDDGHKHNRKFILKESDTKSMPDEKENNMSDLLDKAEKTVPDKKRKHPKQKLPGVDGHMHNKKFILKESDINGITKEKENKIPGLWDKAEKTLSGSDHGHKHKKKFILKESTNSKTDDKKNDSINSSAVKLTEPVKKYGLNDGISPLLIDSIDRYGVTKKSKLTDNKERKSHKHQTSGQDSMKHDLPSQKANTKETKSQKKQNNKSEAFSATVKGSPSSKTHEKVRKIKQEALNILSSEKEKENKDAVDQISVTVHSKAAVMIKKTESWSDFGKETVSSNNVENRVQMSPLCIRCQKENGESQEENTNPANENIVGKTTSAVDINDDSESIMVSKIDMKEKTGANDLDQRKRDMKCQNIVTETKAMYGINILKPSSNAAFTDSNEQPADRNIDVSDQQVVPDMGTEMLADSISSTDLAFSNVPEKSIKNEITDHMLVKTLPCSSSKDEKDWGFDSVKLEESCPQKILNDEDSLDDNDEMILELDENIGDVALAGTNKGYQLHDHFSRDSFFEFDPPDFPDD